MFTVVQLLSSGWSTGVLAVAGNAETPRLCRYDRNAVASIVVSLRRCAAAIAACPTKNSLQFDKVGDE